MYIDLVAHTPNPERVVASAARLCYSSMCPRDNLGSMTDLQISDFVAKLAEVGHESPLEHVTFTFVVDGVSRALSHQLVRHRIASYSQRSQRYVSEKEFDFVVPESILADPVSSKIYANTMVQIQKAYRKLSSLVPREDARYVLPNACHTSLIVTMNVRSLLNFFRVRCCRRAQWEIRKLAEEMLENVRFIAPNLFRTAGRPCEHGPCPEGDMSCKKKEVAGERG